MPLNDTFVLPVKLFPKTVTSVPTAPLVGLNELMLGGVGTVTVKSEALVAVPSILLTLMGPVVAPLGTVARS